MKTPSEEEYIGAWLTEVKELHTKTKEMLKETVRTGCAYNFLSDLSEYLLNMEKVLPGCKTGVEMQNKLTQFIKFQIPLIGTVKVPKGPNELGTTLNQILCDIARVNVEDVPKWNTEELIKENLIYMSPVIDKITAAEKPIMLEINRHLLTYFKNLQNNPVLIGAIDATTTPTDLGYLIGLVYPTYLSIAPMRSIKENIVKLETDIKTLEAGAQIMGGRVMPNSEAEKELPAGYIARARTIKEQAIIIIDSKKSILGQVTGSSKRHKADEQTFKEIEGLIPDVFNLTSQETFESVRLKLDEIKSHKSRSKIINFVPSGEEPIILRVKEMLKLLDEIESNKQARLDTIKKLFDFDKCLNALIDNNNNTKGTDKKTVNSLHAELTLARKTLLDDCNIEKFISKCQSITEEYKPKLPGITLEDFFTRLWAAVISCCNKSYYSKPGPTFWQTQTAYQLEQLSKETNNIDKLKSTGR